ncbi:hypothetical protein ACJ4Z0_01520 [Bifidobacterium catenulatum]|uniref:hypothetical protein n=1 Tax=Bifidobacterium catenulatum TaxID=1686 RepID=UPI003D33FCEB
MVKSKGVFDFRLLKFDVTAVPGEAAHLSLRLPKDEEKLESLAVMVRLFVVEKELLS